VTVDDFTKNAFSSFVNSMRSECSSPEDLMVTAYIELKKWIFAYRIVPGQKLIMKDLTDKLKMSKTPIIYALNRLEYEGFVERFLNRGYFVHEMDRKEAIELFDARAAIEVFSLERAIGNLTKNDLEEIERMVNYHSESNYMNMTPRLIVDMSLHLKIAEITGNNFLIKMLKSLFERLYLTYRFDRMDPGRKIPSEEEHKWILEALKKKDFKTARNHLLEHMKNGQEAILEGLRDYFPERASK